jgi:hypothetical protein
VGRGCEVQQDCLYPSARVHKNARVCLSDCSLFGGLITPTRHQRNYEEARKAFTKAAKFQLDLDWPEMLWETWLTFEHSHGTVEEIQDALDVVERARVQVEARRAKVLNLSC